jgi:hypothetical protein
VATPNTKPATEPAARTATNPAAKPATEPAARTATNPAAKPAAKRPALAQESQQFGAYLQQSQQLWIDAIQTWVNAFSTLPVMDLHKIPGLPDMHDMQAATKFTFDVAADLLSAQREFAVQLTQVLLPAKTP